MNLTQADEGRKVQLAAFEDQPREIAEVLSVSAGTAIVLVEPQDDFDDGQREITFDQVEAYAG